MRDRSLATPVRRAVFATLLATLGGVHAGCTAEESRPPGGDGGTGGSSVGTGGATPGTGTGGASANRECGTGDVRETFSFQVEVPAGTQPLGVASFSMLDRDVTGSVTSVKRASNTVRIEVTEAGQAWTVVVSPASGLDAFETAATALANTNVKLHIRLKRAFQIMPSWGFTLRNTNDELLMAVEAGPFVQTLGADDIAPLTLTNGPDICDAVLCGSGLWAYTQLQVSTSGGASVAVGLGSNGEVASGSRRYTVRNVGAGHHATGSGFACSDIEHSSTWAIWSRAGAQ